MQRVSQRVASTRPQLLHGTFPRQGLQIPVSGRCGKSRGLGDRGQGVFTRPKADQRSEHRHGASHGSAHAAGAVGRGGNRLQQRELPLAVVEDPRVSHNADSIQWPIVPGQDLTHQALNFPVPEFQEVALPVYRGAGTGMASRGRVER
ncbi:hypothetical protein Slala02_58690 [Streptomyces lavendulae subsp. lavendulae]|nr:hypothetical protein Slala01_62100 [Streptomyces lavendulae subsp. lavendulae]GLX30049.1 hypothetical protein Slala02_58690 [Streptomyces lavendulae subsp. lavendulae]